MVAVEMADMDGERAFHQITFRTEEILKDGDKIIPMDGCKGVILILPDEQMPVDVEADKCVDIVINPYSPIARTSAVIKNNVAWGNALRDIVQVLKTVHVDDHFEEFSDKIELGKMLLPWILPLDRKKMVDIDYSYIPPAGSRNYTEITEDHGLFLQNGRGGTPALPPNWHTFSTPEEITLLREYFEQHEDTLRAEEEIHGPGVPIPGETKSISENMLLLWAGEGNTPDLPPNWYLATSQKDVQELKDYLETWREDLIQIAKDEQDSIFHIYQFFGQNPGLPDQPILRIPINISEDDRVQLDFVLGLASETGDEVYQDRSSRSYVIPEPNYDNNSPSLPALHEISAVGGYIHLISAPHKSNNKLNFRPLSSDNQKLRNWFHPLSGEPVRFRGSTPARISSAEIECATIAGVEELFLHSIRSLSNKSTSLNTLAAFLAEPEKGYQLSNLQGKIRNIHHRAQIEPKNLDINYFRDMSFACGLNWNPETGAVSPLSASEIRHRSGRKINSGNGIRNRDSDDQWGHIDLPVTMLHPAARNKDANLDRPLLAGILGLSKQDFYHLVNSPAVPVIPAGTTISTGTISGTKKLQQMLSTFQKEQLDRIDNTELSFQDPKLIGFMADKLANEASLIELTKDSPPTERARKERCEIQAQSLEIWSEILETNPDFNPANYFLDSFPILPKKLLQNFQEIHNQNAYFGNLEQSYHKIINRIETFQSDGSNKSLRSLDRSFQELLFGVNPDKARKTSELPVERRVKGMMQRVVGKYSAVYDFLSGSRVSSSGRGVIVPDPILYADEIRLPWTSVVELCEEKLKAMAQEKHTNKTEKQIDRMIRSGDPKMVGIAEQIFKDRPIIAGRQPTLHVNNMQSFYVKFWKNPDGSAIISNDAIGWSPMNCDPMNADFDGDTAWAMWNPIRKVALELHQHLSPYSRIMLRLGRDLSPAINFGHECLDGLCRTETERLKQILADSGVEYPNFRNAEYQSPTEIKELQFYLVEQAEKGLLKPEQHREIHRSLMQQGFRSATLDNVSLGTETAYCVIADALETHYQNILSGDYVPAQHTKEVLQGAELMRQTREDLDFRLRGNNPYSKDRKKDAMVYGRFHQEMIRFVQKDLRDLIAQRIETGSYDENLRATEALRLVEICNNKVRIKPGNLLRLCFAFGLTMNAEGCATDRICCNPLYMGLNAKEFSALRRASGISNQNSKNSVSLGGHLLNTLRQNFWRFKVTTQDCETERSTRMYSAMSDFKIAEGACLAESVPGIEAGTFLNRKHIQQLRQERVTEIQFRSVQHCEAKEVLTKTPFELKVGDVLAEEPFANPAKRTLDEEDILAIRSGQLIPAKEIHYSRKTGETRETPREDLTLDEILKNPHKQYELLADCGGVLAGQQITPDNIEQLEIPSFFQIENHNRTSCCQTCCGTSSDRSGKLVPKLEIGTKVGSYVATSLTEPVTQGDLRQFHDNGVMSVFNDFGMVQTITAGLYDQASQGNRILAETAGEFPIGTILDSEIIHQILDQGIESFQVLNTEWRNPEELVPGTVLDEDRLEGLLDEILEFGWKPDMNHQTPGNALLDAINRVPEAGESQPRYQELVSALGEDANLANRTLLYRFVQEASDPNRALSNQRDQNKTDRASSTQNVFNSSVEDFNMLRQRVRMEPVQERQLTQQYWKLHFEQEKAERSKSETRVEPAEPSTQAGPARNASNLRS